MPAVPKAFRFKRSKISMLALPTWNIPLVRDGSLRPLSCWFILQWRQPHAMYKRGRILSGRIEFALDLPEGEFLCIQFIASHPLHFWTTLLSYGFCFAPKLSRRGHLHHSCLPRIGVGTGSL